MSSLVKHGFDQHSGIYITYSPSPGGGRNEKLMCGERRKGEKEGRKGEKEKKGEKEEGRKKRVKRRRGEKKRKKEKKEK